MFEFRMPLLRALVFLLVDYKYVAPTALRGFAAAQFARSDLRVTHFPL